MVSKEQMLEDLGYALNLLAFLDEETAHEKLFSRYYGGGEKIEASFGMVQSTIDDLYERIEQEGVTA